MFDTNNELLLHSWYRFRGKTGAIIGWSTDFAARILRTSLQHPFPEVALFFEAEKMGVISMMLFNRRQINSAETRLLHDTFLSPDMNAFCVGQMVRGENCTTCPIHLSGAVPIAEGAFVDMRFGRCNANQLHQELVREIMSSDQTPNQSMVRRFSPLPAARLGRVRELIRARYANSALMGWDRLLNYINQQLTADNVQQGGAR